MPEADEAILEFGAKLAERLATRQFIPLGSTEFQIECLLTGNKRGISMSDAQIMSVAAAIFPQNFVDEIRAHQEELNAFLQSRKK